MLDTMSAVANFGVRWCTIICSGPAIVTGGARHRTAVLRQLQVVSVLTKYTISLDRKRKRNVCTIYIRSKFARIFALAQYSTKHSRSSLYDASYDICR